ncbi:hypothetical protein PWT90_03437 [Aphanocladium album]|nr:hypothetical protein PWT90_03437 [Aphanocladium album]
MASLPTSVKSSGKVWCQKAKRSTKTRSPAAIDFRVAQILDIKKHPNADKLYVSIVAAGDEWGSRDCFEYNGQMCQTVCSGLSGLIPLNKLHGRKIVVVRNVKPVEMCGAVSTAMFFAAVSETERVGESPRCVVELVDPPTDSRVGDRLFFENWDGVPRAKFSTQKTLWKATQPGFRTTDNLEVVFIPKNAGLDGQSGHLVTEKGGRCTVRSLKNAAVR